MSKNIVKIILERKMNIEENVIDTHLLTQIIDKNIY